MVGDRHFDSNRLIHQLCWSRIGASRMAWLTPLLWLKIFKIIALALVCWCVYRFRKRTGSRIAALRDWLAYITISIALVVAIILIAAYGPKNSPVKGKWILFAFNTLFVFGYTLKAVRPFWTKLKLWCVITGLALLHVLVGCAVILRVEESPSLWYVPIDLAEIWLFLVTIQLACRVALPPLRKPQA